MHILDSSQWNLTVAKHLTVLSSKCDDAFRLSSFHFNCFIVFWCLSGPLLMDIEGGFQFYC